MTFTTGLRLIIQQIFTSSTWTQNWFRRVQEAKEWHGKGKEREVERESGRKVMESDAYDCINIWNLLLFSHHQANQAYFRPREDRHWGVMVCNLTIFSFNQPVWWKCPWHKINFFANFPMLLKPFLSIWIPFLYLRSPFPKVYNRKLAKT